MARIVRTHVYKGYTLLPCSWQDSIKAGYRWYLAAYHFSGVMLSEELSPRFRSLKQARQYVTDMDAQDIADGIKWRDEYRAAKEVK